jgi:hypothetical protein
LKAYGSKLPLKNPCIDPRFGIIPRCSAKNIYEMNFHWCKSYGKAMEDKLRTLLGLPQL